MLLLELQSIVDATLIRAALSILFASFTALIACLTKLWVMTSEPSELFVHSPKLEVSAGCSTAVNITYLSIALTVMFVIS